MPVYTYQAIDKRGQKLTGQMPALDEATLREKLKQNEVWLLDAKLHRAPTAMDKAAESRSGWRGGSLKRRDLINFCTLMSFQAKVGVPLIQALELASHDCDNPAMRAVLVGLQRQIEAGYLFYEAMEKYPKVFTPHFISVIRAGEMSSKLPEAFGDLRDYLEWVEQITADVRQASIYPGIVLSVVSCFVVCLFIFIIPKFAGLLKSVNAELPLLTQIVFSVADFFKTSWWLWLLVIPVLVITLQVSRRYSKRVALWYDQTKLKLPVLGELNWMLAISRFTHNLSILYRSGIPIVQALNLCQGLTGNVVVEKAVLASEEAVKAGATVSEAMRKHPVFPPLLIRMVVMGETTGNLDHALDNVSEYYSDIIPRRIKKMLAALEPALTVFMILVVGLTALSIYLPIISLMGAIQKG